MCITVFTKAPQIISTNIIHSTVVGHSSVNLIRKYINSRYLLTFSRIIKRSSSAEESVEHTRQEYEENVYSREGHKKTHNNA